jgi:hypothetical protein
VQAPTAPTKEAQLASVVPRLAVGSLPLSAASDNVKVQKMTASIQKSPAESRAQANNTEGVSIAGEAQNLEPTLLWAPRPPAEIRRLGAAMPLLPVPSPAYSHP